MKVSFVCIVAVLVSISSFSSAQETTGTALPAPRMEGGKPLMQCLKERQTSRSFDTKKLSPQVLSDLLWAAAGINRPDTNKRTVPSAKNWQEVEVYAITEDGAYAYDAKANKLESVATGDLRKMAGMQDFVASAPLNLAYVVDSTKMKGSSPDDQGLYSGADTGFMVQNVYLFCASEGLATVVRGSVDRKALGEALKLPANKKVTLVQTVGYPAAAGK